LHFAFLAPNFSEVRMGVVRWRRFFDFLS